jgi:hypothetical protein
LENSLKVNLYFEKISKCHKDIPKVIFDFEQIEGKISLPKTTFVILFADSIDWVSLKMKKA